MAEFWNDCHIFCDVFSFSTCKRSSKTDSFSHSSKHFFSHDDSQPSPGQSESVSLCSAMSGIQHLTTKSTNFNTNVQHTNNRKKSQINNDACAWAQCATQAQVANCIRNVRRKCFSADVTFCNNGIPCNDNAFSISRASKRHIPQFCPQVYTVVTVGQSGELFNIQNHRYWKYCSGTYCRRYDLSADTSPVQLVVQPAVKCKHSRVCVKMITICACCKVNGCRWKWQYLYSPVFRCLNVTSVYGGMIIL